MYLHFEKRNVRNLVLSGKKMVIRLFLKMEGMETMLWNNVWGGSLFADFEGNMERLILSCEEWLE